MFIPVKTWYRYAERTALRRFVLGIHGTETQLVGGAVDSDADEIFFDLEDSLGPSENVAARSTLIDILSVHD